MVRAMLAIAQHKYPHKIVNDAGTPQDRKWAQLGELRSLCSMGMLWNARYRLRCGGSDGLRRGRLDDELG